MGSFEIKSKKLRCIKCLDVRRILIVPGYPEPKIEIMCHCNKSIEPLFDYCKEFNKETDFKLVCANCGKEGIKHPRFCYECLEVYCSKCCDIHTPKKTSDNNSVIRQTLAGHKTIHVEKMDFYCINHQKENFIGYCQQCLMNICPQCVREKEHEHHKVDYYDIINIDKKEKEKIKKNIKNAKTKIEKNNKTFTTFIKKNKKNVNCNDIEEEYKIIAKENEDILDLLNYCYDAYDQSKGKNFSIAYNLKYNSKFNLKLLKLEKKAENNIEEIKKYLNNDAFILCKRSQSNTEQFQGENEGGYNDEDEKKDEAPLTTVEDMIHRKFSDPKIETNNNINLINDNDNNNDNYYVLNTAPNNFLKEEEEDPNFDELEEEEKKPNIIINNNPQPPKNEIKKLAMQFNFKPEEKKPAPKMPPPKKLKMPLMFEKREEEKKPEKPLPAKAKLSLPSIFERKEEDNKPKERAAIIQTGAIGLGNKKDLLTELMAKKANGVPGKPKSNSIAFPVVVEFNKPVEEKIEIIHESNEAGNTEQVLNKVAVTTKKKKET